MKELFFDIERSGEYKHVLSLSSYLVAREDNRRSNRFVPKYDEYCKHSICCIIYRDANFATIARF